jgi:hypothetical protein
MATVAPARRPARSTGRAARARAVPARRAPAPARLVPIAVGKTAGAVGDLADSGLIFRLTRGRAWIALLGVLLTGIVAINVASVSLNASLTKLGTQTDTLERQNSVLRTRIAKQLSGPRVRGVAAQLGLSIPDPAAITYLTWSDRYASIAAHRLASGQLRAGSATAPPIPFTPSSSSTAVAPVTPSSPAPVPVTPSAPATAPATSAPATTAPAASTGGPSAPSGGVGGIAP